METFDIKNTICRAKRIDNDEWVDGYFVFDNDYFIVKNLHMRVRGTAELVNVYTVKHDTVCRAVCKNDKNGTPIFEGDIISYFGGWKYIVRYGEFNGTVGLGYYYGVGFYLEKIGDETHRVPLSSISCDKGEYEIVGNIYDNPELLVVDD